MPTRKKRQARKTPTKLFVLDTNVLMHDPTSLFRFEEHDIFLPIMTLEELDNHKVGMSEVSRNARQASRFLDEIISKPGGKIQDGIALQRYDADSATGRMFMQTEAMNGVLPASLPIGKADNQIIGVLIWLQKRDPHRQVILVSRRLTGLKD